MPLGTIVPGPVTRSHELETRKPKAPVLYLAYRGRLKILVLSRLPYVPVEYSDPTPMVKPAAAVPGTHTSRLTGMAEKYLHVRDRKVFMRGAKIVLRVKGSG
jgi:hypothetical protein